MEQLPSQWLHVENISFATSGQWLPDKSSTAACLYLACASDTVTKTIQYCQQFFPWLSTASIYGTKNRTRPPFWNASKTGSRWRSQKMSRQSTKRKVTLSVSVAKRLKRNVKETPRARRCQERWPPAHHANKISRAHSKNEARSRTENSDNVFSRWLHEGLFHPQYDEIKKWILEARGILAPYNTQSQTNIGRLTYAAEEA